ncbi:MAG: cytidylate kinase-like family protein [Nitrospinota bacterium]|nr:cytidylate kinase-like family protein [Nitrospinota bacterium]
MGILAVSRQLGSGGDIIAKLVAQELGWNLLDNEAFSKSAEEFGYVRDELEHIDERKPGLIERFFRDSQLVYHDVVRSIMYEYAIKGNCVLLGRGGNIIMSDIPGVLKVRVIAPVSVRSKRLVENEEITKSMAEKFIEHNDQERTSYTRHFFNAEWGEAVNFDLVINTENVSFEDARDTILELLKENRKFHIDSSALNHLKDLSYSQKIKAKLMADDRIDATGVTVFLKGESKLLVSGRVNSEEEKEIVNEICSGLHLDGELENEILIIPPIEGWYPV